MEFYVARCKGWDNVPLHRWDTPVAICIFTTKPMLLQSLSALDLLVWSLLCQLRQISTVMLCSRSSAPSWRENGFLFLEGTVGVLTVWWHMNSWHSWHHLHPQVFTQGLLRKIHLDPGEEGSTGSMTEQPPAPLLSGNSISLCFECYPFFTTYKCFSHFGFTPTSAAETADDGTVWPFREDSPEMHWSIPVCIQIRLGTGKRNGFEDPAR